MATIGFMCGSIVVAIVVLLVPTIADLFPTPDPLYIVAMCVLFVVFPIGYGIYSMVTDSRAAESGAMCTQNQFRWVAEIADEVAEKMGLEHTPTVVVVSGSLPLSDSIYSFGRAVIMLHSDFVVAPPNERGEACRAIRFAIAREMGLIDVGVRSLKYRALTSLSQATPVVKHILSRAEGYTADRYGSRFSPESAEDYFGVIAVSKDSWMNFSALETLAQSKRFNLGQVLSVWAGSTMPLPWRLYAARQLGMFSPDPVPATDESLKNNYGAFWRAPTLDDSTFR